MPNFDVETSRNLHRVATNLTQPTVVRLLTAIQDGDSVTGEDIAYLHSLVEDAERYFARAVEQLPN